MKKYETRTLYCRCGCDNGVTFKVDKEHGEIFISFVSNIFYMKQTSFFNQFKEKLRRIWYVIANKEYCYFDIVIDQDDIEEFKKIINEM